MARSRPLLTAELLSIGSELTVGETRDTNSGELARSLTDLGVRVGRIQALPDDMAVVTEAFADALDRVDLVVSTGGLGPTPDDLTREAIAAAIGEVPAVDPDLEAWLRGLWSRRSMPMPEINLKQAWLIPSAVALPNGEGTAPAWWVERPDGRIVVTLPGPPREMRPIWAGHVLPRLRERGVGDRVARRTFRLAGVGESLVADVLGEEMLRSTNPIVATYARADAVDVRISARPEGQGPDARSADQIVEEAASRVLELLGSNVWAEGETSWADAIGHELEALGWGLATLEIGTGGSLAALLGDRPWLRFAESLALDAPAARRHEDASDEASEAEADGRGAAPAGATSDGLEALTRRAREVGATEVAVGLRGRPRRGDTAVAVVVVAPDAIHRERRLVFLDGPQGRSRAGLAGAAVLLTQLREARTRSGR
jgi:nicotinamide-nucleotide amidase